MGEIRDSIQRLKTNLEQICTDAQSPSAELSEASIRREFKNSFPSWMTEYQMFLTKYRNHTHPRAKKWAQELMAEVNGMLAPVYDVFEQRVRTSIADPVASQTWLLLYQYNDARDVAKALIEGDESYKQRIKILHDEVVSIVGGELPL